MAKLRFAGGQVLTSYSYTDIVSGVGIQNFYAGNLMFLSGGVLTSGMILSSQPFYSSPMTSKGPLQSQSFVKTVNRSIDLTFGIPRIVNGSMIVNIPLGISSQANASPKYVYADIYAYHVNGAGTETFLVSGQTYLYKASGTTTGEAYSIIQNVSLPLTNQKFGNSEKLRLKVEVFAKGDTTTLFSAGFAHDPQNRVDNNNGVIADGVNTGPIIEDTTAASDGRYSTDTTFILQVPFKLEVDV